METKTKEKKSLRGYIAAALAMAALLFAAFGAGFLLRGNATEEAPEITAALIAQEVSGITEYASLAYHYTNVGKFEDRVDFYGWKVPFTTKSFIITYDGSMKLGVLGRDIQVELEGDEIRILLPEAQILSHEIYEDTLEVLDQTKNIFNQIQIEDYRGFAIDQKREMEQKARDGGLLADARERAQQQLGEFLGSFPGIRDQYTFVFLPLPEASGAGAKAPSASSAGPATP